MTTIDVQPPAYSQSAPRRSGWFARTEGWLDDKGKGAWIAAMVLGFIFVWPVGLALLFYMIWSKRMFSKSCKSSWNHDSRRATMHSARAAMRPSGNRAFDAYKSDTLRRLEEEQRNFEDFLERLREAKDKAEFDDFMDDRAKRASREAQTETDYQQPPRAEHRSGQYQEPQREGSAFPRKADDDDGFGGYNQQS
ncbi:MAG: DUF2852 domain-containing protein [Rhodobacteraceae bacterium]|nr:DUF2852 domain-containing protein [Paracoccaceae bacterium]